jgi:hypothetical protein
VAGRFSLNEVQKYLNPPHPQNKPESALPAAASFYVILCQSLYVRRMTSFLKKNILTVSGILAGCLGGFLYWKYVGCSNGTCYIQSNPYRMTAYGALMGGLVFNIFQGWKR